MPIFRACYSAIRLLKFATQLGRQVSRWGPTPVEFCFGNLTIRSRRFGPHSDRPEQLLVRSGGLATPNIPGQVDGYTPPAFFQFVDSDDRALFFPIRENVCSDVARYINNHSGEIVSNRSGEIEPIPCRIQRCTNLFGVL